MPDDATTDRELFEASYERLRYQLGKAQDTLASVASERDAAHDTIRGIANKLWGWIREDDVAIDALVLDAVDRIVLALQDAQEDRDLWERRAEMGCNHIELLKDENELLRGDVDNYQEALHDLGVEDWDTSWGARGAAIARAEQIAALERMVPS